MHIVIFTVLNTHQYMPTGLIRLFDKPTFLKKRSIALNIYIWISTTSFHHTIYPMKYARDFVVHFAVVILYVLMDSGDIFTNMNIFNDTISTTYYSSAKVLL